jgi:hypothetical protein
MESLRWSRQSWRDCARAGQELTLRALFVPGVGMSFFACFAGRLQFLWLQTMS